MGFMDYWIVPNPDGKEPQKESTQVVKNEPANSFPGTTFPTTVPVQPVAPVIGATNCEPHMKSIMDLYEKGFDGLNRDGVEFFEFFKAVAAANFDNGAYKMALSVLSGMEKTMTKESLIEQSAYYITEIDNVHQKYTQNGILKRTEVEKNKAGETEQLRNDLTLLNEQLQAMKAQIESKTISLQQIDSKYAPSLEEVQCKMAANDLAKDKIVGTLNAVVQGIKNNL